jgi:hypothetical protein
VLLHRRQNRAFEQNMKRRRPPLDEPGHRSSPRPDGYRRH